MEKREEIAALKELIETYKQHGYWSDVYNLKGRLFELQGHW